MILFTSYGIFAISGDSSDSNTYNLHIHVYKFIYAAWIQQLMKRQSFHKHARFHLELIE